MKRLIRRSVAWVCYAAIEVSGMFGMYEDRRTPEERRRDLEQQDKRRAEKFLALGFLKNTVRPLLKDSGADVGLAGEGNYSGAELLVEVDGVTYKLSASVDHDQ